MRKIFTALLCMLVILTCPVYAAAEQVQAEDISDQTEYTSLAYVVTGFLKDKKTDHYVYNGGNTDITLENPEGMASVYLRLNMPYGAYTVTDNTTGKTVTLGEDMYLHQFVDLVALFDTTPTSVTLLFDNGTVAISELYVFSQGELPDFVQRWEPPLDGAADILLMPTHGDDDQLYFAGTTPYYAGELDCAVQVVYMTDHRIKDMVRMHEMLDGLWATGVENYPIFGFSFDFRIDDRDATYARLKDTGILQEDLDAFVVEMFRRFKPQVVVAHDVNGEYGHGMHQVYTDVVMRCVEVSADPEAFPESAEKYGVWDVPKTYLHLWEENPIVLPLDVPLDSYGGLTAFQVSQQRGFPCHVSQQRYDDYTLWLYGPDREITQSTQIELYNPAFFGLYRTTVGPDVNKNDFLENITTYAEQARQEQERLEQERLEQERLEQERLEQERLEQERQEQERLEQEKNQQTDPTRTTMSQEEFEKVWEETKENSRAENRKIYLLIGAVIVLVVAFRIAMGAAKKNFRKNPVKDRMEQEKKYKK